ncbi:hypothetical protein [Holdemania massiliensis]|uniref:hypothetical protein n=1 Tax=Holdemania massiliensis TaxID=1468449 RepID=UPI002431FD68|nr:hypothetical protein [Holdemania massiliensis]
MRLKYVTGGIYGVNRLIFCWILDIMIFGRIAARRALTMKWIVVVEKAPGFPLQ